MERDYDGDSPERTKGGDIGRQRALIVIWVAAGWLGDGDADGHMGRISVRPTTSGVEGRIQLRLDECFTLLPANEPFRVIHQDHVPGFQHRQQQILKINLPKIALKESGFIGSREAKSEKPFGV